MPAVNTEDPALKKMDRSPSLQGVVVLGQENRPLTKLVSKISSTWKNRYEKKRLQRCSVT